MATTNKSEKEDLNRGKNTATDVKSEAGGISSESNTGWERSESSRKDEPGVTTGGLSRIQGGKSGNLSEVRGNLAEKSSEMLEKAQNVVTDFARNAGDKVSEWGGSARDIATQAGENVGTMVRRYPVASVFAGFGLGIVFGLLIPRRR